MVRGPGVPTGTVVTSQATANVDLAATILRLHRRRAAWSPSDGRLAAAGGDRSRSRIARCCWRTGIRLAAIRTPRLVLHQSYTRGSGAVRPAADPYQMKSLHASKKQAVRRRKQSLARDLRTARVTAPGDRRAERVTGTGAAKRLRRPGTPGATRYPEFGLVGGHRTSVAPGRARLAAAAALAAFVAAIGTSECRRRRSGGRPGRPAERGVGYSPTTRTPPRSRS